MVQFGWFGQGHRHVWWVSPIADFVLKARMLKQSTLEWQRRRRCLFSGSKKNKVKGEIKGKNRTIRVAGQELRIVEQYKHMGSMCTPGAAMGPEVSWRVDRTRVAYFAIAVRFFAAANFSLKCKKSVADCHGGEQDKMPQVGFSGA